MPERVLTSDFWQTFSGILKTPKKDLFLSFLASAPESVKQALTELFAAFEIEWTYKILKVLAIEGSCNKKQLAAKLFAGEKGDIRGKLRRGNVDDALCYLESRGYIVRVKGVGREVVYEISQRYRAACESVLVATRVPLVPEAIHRVRLWFPNQDSAGHPRPNREKWLTESLNFILKDVADPDPLKQKFALIQTRIGSRNSKTERSNQQKATIIECFTAQLDNQKFEKVLEHARSVKHDTKQDSVMVEVDGTMYFV
jgi:hypothetical protein